MTTILVTGSTGTLGRAVVERLLGAGHHVHGVSRGARAATAAPRYTPMAVDLRAGSGLDTALAGVETVIHCATTVTGGDERAARNLIGAARRAGVSHLVYISIVGVDRVPLGYYRAKLAVERLVERSGLGWTILRTTQFHDLVRYLCSILARSMLMPVPAGVSVQPVDSGEVADRLVRLAAAEPAGRAPDMGGPRICDFADLARSYLRATGRRRILVPLRLPGGVFRAYRAGGHLAPERAVGRVTFEEFLAARSTGSGREGE